MSHHANQIIDKIVSLIEAQVPDAKVYAHRRHSLSYDMDELPAISVDLGSDAPQDTQPGTTVSIFTVLEVKVSIVVRARTEPELKDELMSLLAGVHVAIMTDRQLALSSFVLTTYYGGFLEPEVEAGDDGIFGSLTSMWPVMYKMAIANPEA